MRPAVEGVHTAGMIRPRRGHGLLRPRLRMSSVKTAVRCAGAVFKRRNVSSRKSMIDPPTWLTVPPPFTVVVVGVDSVELRCVEDGDEVLCFG